MKLVILGNSLTALAVVHNAKSNGLQPVLIDTEQGIASQTSKAVVVVKNTSSEAEILAAILEHAGQENYFIATSDRWLTFSMHHRSQLAAGFARILGPDDKVLSICLDKHRFSTWCCEQGLPVPKMFNWDGRAESLPVAEDVEYFVRPVVSSAQFSDVPKTLLAKNNEELIKKTQAIGNKDIGFIVTESLLAHELTQFSVPFVRTEKGIRLFVARKIRPFPNDCSVGTYVALQENAEVEQLARELADKLDYYGVGELEILYSHTTGKNYIIELNARPWVQYNLAVKSGYDFLRYMISPETYNFSGERKNGKYWLNFIDDLYICFSRQQGYIWSKKLSFTGYAISLLKSNVSAAFYSGDSRPFRWYLSNMFK